MPYRDGSFGHKDSISTYVYHCFRPSVRIRIRFKAFYLRHTKHPGIGDPLRVYDIDPNVVTFAIMRKNFDRLAKFGVVGGDWHNQATLFNDLSVYKMFRSQFEYGVPWEDTKRYEIIVDRLEAGGSTGVLDVPKNKQSVEMYDAYLSYFDELYDDIRFNGYKRQTELDSSTDFLDVNYHLN